VWRRIAWLAALILIAIAAYGLFALLWGVPSVADHPLSRDPASIAAGKYLAAAGDCVSCHTAAGGEAFAGGRPLVTPFGTIYSANITPDPKTGIGNLNSAQFYQLLAYGADSALAPLYPAMPYTSFHAITRKDSDDLFAYFMSVPAVERPATPNEMAFPFNIRPLMFGWNLLFASRREESGQGRSLEPRRLSGRGARSLRRVSHAAQRARRDGVEQGPGGGSHRQV
jgi:mono/diheme cytochrome c family protein